jgi:hypothetical protein
LGIADTVLKIWAWGALVTVVSWVILYLVYQAVGSNEISFVLTLSAGVAVTIAVLVVGNALKKRL